MLVLLTTRVTTRMTEAESKEVMAMLRFSGVHGLGIRVSGLRCRVMGVGSVRDT